MNKPIIKYSLVIIVTTLSVKVYAGIDYSKYDDPAFFLGWEKSLYFAITTVILFLISSNLSEHYKDEHGNFNGGCILITINFAMIICAICSAYLLIPLFMIYILIKGHKRSR